MALTTKTPRASAQEVRAAAASLRAMAAHHGLSDLRLAADGTLFAHIDHDPGYASLLSFVAEATSALGAEPNVVADETAAAAAKLGTATAL